MATVRPFRPGVRRAVHAPAERWTSPLTRCPVRAAVLRGASTLGARAHRLPSISLIPASPVCSAGAPPAACGADGNGKAPTCPLAIVRRVAPGQRGREGRLDPDRLSRVLAFVEENIDQAISRDMLAEVACLSLTRFSVAFRASMGISPGRYLTQRRVQCAQLMLLTGEDTITEVAMAVGFATPGHFATNFRLLVGMTPTDYREAGRLH